MALRRSPARAISIPQTRRQSEIEKVRPPLPEEIFDFEPVFAVVAVSGIGVLGVWPRVFAGAVARQVEGVLVCHMPSYAARRDFRGTLPPARRASDKPIAMACLRLVTFFPDRPLLNVPALRSRIARSTFCPAFLPYFATGSSR